MVVYLTTTIPVVVSERSHFRRRAGAWRVRALSELVVGQSGILLTLDLPESVQNHLMHMGFVPEARVTVLRRAPAGDPTVYSVDGLEIALRRQTADAIRVRLCESHPMAGSRVEAAGELASATR